jgi:hypothetical protein
VDRGSQVAKALKEIGFEQFYQAEQTGWVLYLEGATDLAILAALAGTLGHPAAEVLERPFVHYVANQPNLVRQHFYGLREAKPDLRGVALFDRLDRPPPDDLGVPALQWRRREIENYIAEREVLLAYARHDLPNDLFGQAEADTRVAAMQAAIDEIAGALRTLRIDPWSADTKASDDFLDRVFERYFERLGLPNLLRKSDYHVLARLMPRDRIDPEITEKLNAIVDVQKQARPRQ